MGIYNFKFFFVLFFILCALFFFNPARINEAKLYYAYYLAFMALFALVFITYRAPVRNLFYGPVVLILIAVLISGISASFFWGQGIIASVKAMVLVFSYILYIQLVNWDFNRQQIERFIIIFAIGYFIVDAISLLLFPMPVFGDISWYDSRGFPRIRMPGGGFLFLFSFLSLSKYLATKKIMWSLLFIISLVFIVFTLTRTLMVSSFAFLTLFALHKSKNIYKLITVFGFLAIFIIISQMEFFKALSDLTSTELKDFENNIRLLAARFYLNDFSPNLFTKIFGNGVAHYDSGYGAYMQYLMDRRGLHQTDIGYLGLYSQYGILALLAFVFIIVRTIRIRVPDDILYLKYFLYFFFTISIIISSTFSQSYIIPLVLALYLLDYHRNTKTIS